MASIDPSGTAEGIAIDAARSLDAGAAPAVARRFASGAEISDGQVDFRLWAPASDAVWLVREGCTTDSLMARDAEGWHRLATDQTKAGLRYQFRLADGSLVPDPASRYQPDGIHGSSELVDAGAYRWRDDGWVNRAWSEAIVYELHIGAFTPAGTFLSAIAKLDHLVELGVTCLNLMPVAQCPGDRNWGYDGVFLYAPSFAYGRPDDLKAFVDAAHAHGLMVLLDVVYNHFGPDGNLMSNYAPQIFTDRHQTPWGDAINFDGEGSAFMRTFAIENALYWLEDFHFDGLRFDAVHAIVDESPLHILDELASRVRERCAPRLVHLVIENEENEARRLAPAGGPSSKYTAQWNDDIHHVLHTALTGETDSYYVDFQGDTTKLGRALAEGFAFQGERMRSTGKKRGENSTRLPPGAFVSFLQNHDQVGNRAMGDRIHAIASPAAARAAGAVYLLLPQVPMLFMGEEWGSRRPFPFFCDFEAETGALVVKGRRDEFSGFAAFEKPEQRARIPDPQSRQTFDRAKLDWEERHETSHAGWLAWYTALIDARKRAIAPIVDRIVGAGSFEVIGRGAVVVRFPIGPAGRVLQLVANLSDGSCGGHPAPQGVEIWTEGRVDESGVADPWTVRWSMEETP